MKIVRYFFLFFIYILFAGCKKPPAPSAAHPPPVPTPPGHLQLVWSRPNPYIQCSFIAQTDSVVSYCITNLNFQYRFQAYNKFTGDSLWTFTDDLSIPDKFNQVGDILYFYAGRAIVYALNIKTGKLVWKFKHPLYSYINGIDDLHFTNGLLLVAFNIGVENTQSDSTVICSLNLGNGKATRVFALKTKDNNGFQPNFHFTDCWIAPNGNRILPVSIDNFNRQTFETKMSIGAINIDSMNFYFYNPEPIIGSVASLASVVKNKAYFLDWDTLLAIDLTTKKEVFKIGFLPECKTGGNLQYLNDMIVLKAGNNPVTSAYDLETGALIWKNTTVSTESSPYFLYKDRYYLLYKGAYICSVYPSNGSILWKQLAPNNTSTDDYGDALEVDAVHGNLYVNDFNTLYCYKILD